MNVLAQIPVGQLEARSAIQRMEDYLHQMVAEGVAEQTFHDATSDEGNDEADHLFGDGVYVRGLWIPAGNLVVGRTHRQARVCIVSAGRCYWSDEYSEGAHEVQAPWAAEFPAGSKTVVYAVEDTYWLACLGTNLKDSQQIAEDLTTRTHEQYQRLLEQREVLP